MGKSIYTYYKERLIEIGGKNKCLYLKNIVRKSAFDIGKIFEGRDKKLGELVDFLWSAGKEPLTLISKEETHDIVGNLEIGEQIHSEPADDFPETEEEAKAARRRKRQIASEETKAVELEIAKLKDLKREVEEIEKETGRYELYVGYPFVFGALQQGPAKTAIKAPLILFPVKIELPDEETV